jgi:hypothetical protein
MRRLTDRGGRIRVKRYLFYSGRTQPITRPQPKACADEGLNIPGHRKPIEMVIAADQPVLAALRRAEFDDKIRGILERELGLTLHGVRVGSSRDDLDARAHRGR